MMSFTGADFIWNFRMSRDTFIHTPKHFTSVSQQESEVRQEMYKLHKLTGLLAKKNQTGIWFKSQLKSSFAMIFGVQTIKTELRYMSFLAV